MEITNEKLDKSKLSKGSDMADGRLEWYYQSLDGKDFYLWDMNGVFTVDLEFEGYDSRFKIELKDWEELESLFCMIIRQPIN